MFGHVVRLDQYLGSYELLDSELLGFHSFLDND